MMRTAGGRVECTADFYLLKPVDPQAGNRRVLLDVPNRGRKMALSQGGDGAIHSIQGPWVVDDAARRTSSTVLAT